jgi:anaerobic selenocysteine-containing dehydrogenase
MKTTTRRNFIKLSAAAGGAFGFGLRSTSLFAEKLVKPLRILILGAVSNTQLTLPTTERV